MLLVSRRCDDLELSESAGRLADQAYPGGHWCGAADERLRTHRDRITDADDEILGGPHRLDPSRRIEQRADGAVLEYQPGQPHTGVRLEPNRGCSTLQPGGQRHS